MHKNLLNEILLMDEQSLNQTDITDLEQVNYPSFPQETDEKLTYIGRFWQ